MEGRLLSSLTKSKNRLSRSMTVGSKPRPRSRAASVRTPSWAAVFEWGPTIKSESMESATGRAGMRGTDRFGFTPSGRMLHTFVSDNFVLELRAHLDHHQLGFGDRR